VFYPNNWKLFLASWSNNRVYAWLVPSPKVHPHSKLLSRVSLKAAEEHNFFPNILIILGAFTEERRERNYNVSSESVVDKVTVIKLLRYVTSYYFK
jgi:hypothetical protein